MSLTLRHGTTHASGMSLTQDNRPMRALAAQVVLDAVKSLKSQRADARAQVDRDMAHVFFTRTDTDAAPCNLAWCCQVLDLDSRAMRDRIPSLKGEEVQRMFWRSDRKKR